MNQTMCINDFKYSAQWCTLYTVHFKLYTVHFTLYTVHCTLHTVHCTLYTVHCTLYTLNCTLYTLHCKLYIVFYFIYSKLSLVLLYIFIVKNEIFFLKCISAIDQIGTCCVRRKHKKSICMQNIDQQTFPVFWFTMYVLFYTL